MMFGLGKKSKTEPNSKPNQVDNSTKNTTLFGHSTNGVSHENISIPRSDGKKHDLTAVISAPGVASIIKQESLKVEETDSARSTNKDNHEEHDNISIMRSDGLTHDIIRVFKAQSDIGGDAFRIKPSRASTRNSKGMININFSLSSSVLLSKNSSTKEAVEQAQLQAANNASVLGKIESTFYPKTVRIVHMSDTHNFLKKTPQRSPFLPHGDILVHTGSFSNGGTTEEYIQFNDWLGSVTDLYHYRIICLGSRDVKVCGNDWDEMKKMLNNATHVLCHSETVVLGIRFYASPWHWGHKTNYSVRPGAPSSTSGRFDDIPDGVHVLLTHVPAYDRLDVTTAAENKEHWGSRELAEAVRRVKPGLHLHGHVKDSRGALPAFGNSPLTVNSAMCDKDVTVMYACPHVIRATQLSIDKGLVNWSFALDTLDG